MILPASCRKVLTVQSHVVHGYVGNKASTFPLQCLNWDVDVMNTVNFSNHTGYGKVHGSNVTHHDILELFEGLKAIGSVYDALLTGYAPDGASLRAVSEIGTALKRENPHCVWLLDPVMGDEGQMYVSESVIPIYREVLNTGEVDIITPNQYEAELLLGVQINDVDGLKAAIKDLHTTFNLDHVVITSLSQTFTDLLQLEDSDEFIYTVVSSKDEKDSVISPTVFKVPRLNSYFTGVGDLFSALLLDRISGSKLNIVDAVDEVLTIMSKVLKVTQLLTLQKLGKPVEGNIGDATTMKEAELRIIESRDYYHLSERKFQPFSVDKLI